MKRFFKVIAIFMIVILCAGSVSLLFDGGSSYKPSGPGTIVQKPPTDTDVPEEPEVPDEPDVPEEPEVCPHVDADDNELCDTCGESFTDGQDLFGGTNLINLTFSDSVTFDTNSKYNLYGLDTGGIKYGIFTTSKGYVNYYSQESDAGVTKDAYVNLKFQPSGYGVAVSSFDYLTIDFDFWTDGKYPKNISFIPAGTKTDGNLGYASTNSLNIAKGTDGSYLTLSGQSSEVNFMAIDEPLHITYVIKIDHLNVVNSKVYVYVNGKYITSEASPLLDYADLTHLRVLIGNHSVTAGESICFDNFTVATFGSGNGAYSGDISELFGDTSINLTECADSVLYNKNN